MRTAFQRAGPVVAVAASALVAVPATADAAAAAASPTAVCGADGHSYSVVASSPVKFSSGTVAGTVYLLYSSSKNCVVTVRTSYTGTATFTTAQLIIQNGNTYVDQGNYNSYAGPVRGGAAGKCVKYWGSINTGPDGQAGANAGGGRMSWGNCG
ncbi:hypothetical protein OG612_11960 [Streptomyces sp. NBC_01527]|uniref:hypothetical protein n=1 Tax=Streptomyces sp. NBC_01527 TaxID=2903894 RepID=UPI00386BEE50